MDDPGLKKLKDLVDEAIALQEKATKVVEEITDQLQRSISMHDDRGVAMIRPKRDRRRVPRT